MAAVIYDPSKQNPPRKGAGLYTIPGESLSSSINIRLDPGENELKDYQVEALKTSEHIQAEIKSGVILFPSAKRGRPKKEMTSDEG